MSDPELDPIDEAVAQIEALMSYRRRAFCAHPLTREVSVPQVHVLMRLDEAGPLMVSELAHLLDISLPSASSIVDRMVEHGLVERVRNEADRRVVHVAITQRGHAVVEQFGGPKSAQLRKLFVTMTPQELEHVIRGVEAVRRALERVQAAEDPPSMAGENVVQFPEASRRV